MKPHSIFTDHIKDLLEGVNSLPEELLSELKNDLKLSLRKRGLFPRDLDYSGEHWSGDTLDEIAFDCYAFAFIGLEGTPGHQREYLEAKVRSGKSIEGLVKTKIRWFVQELHQRKYPRDSGIFKNLRKAVQELVFDENNRLTLLSQEEKISSPSILGFSGMSEASSILIDEIGEFITASKSWLAALRVMERFSSHATEMSKTAINETADAGKLPFRLGDLKVVAADKIDELVGPESRTNSAFETHENEIHAFSRTENEESRYSNVEYSDKLIEEVYLAIESLSKGARTKEQIRKVFDAFVTKRRLAGVGEKVKQAEVRLELGIARSTMSDYMNILQKLETPIVENFLRETGR